MGYWISPPNALRYIIGIGCLASLSFLFTSTLNIDETFGNATYTIIEASIARFSVEHGQFPDVEVRLGILDRWTTFSGTRRGVVHDMEPVAILLLLLRTVD